MGNCQMGAIMIFDVSILELCTIHEEKKKL